MTNDELLLKLIERIKNHLEDTQKDLEEEVEQDGDLLDDFDKGWINGIESCIALLEWIQEGDIDLYGWKNKP
jgi:hypothetical protein